MATTDLARLRFLARHGTARERRQARFALRVIEPYRRRRRKVAGSK